MPPNQDDQRGGRGLLLGAVAALLVVGCCALLPLLVVGGTITGIGTLLRNDGAQRISPELLIEVPQVAGLG